MPLRTIVLSGQKFNYDQAVFGSYKRYFPDAYCLGYHVITTARREFGVDVWEKVMNNTTKFSFNPYSFSASMRRFTKLNASKYYKHTINELETVWNKQLEGVQLTDAKIINKVKKKSLTNYQEPQYLNDTTIIVRKASFDEPTAFYKVFASGNEVKLKQTDADLTSVNANKIAWARTIPDARWTQRDYSDIVVLNLKTMREVQITWHCKYFAPALSPNGEQVAVVEYTPAMKCALLIIDSHTGNVVRRFESPNNEFIRTPRYSKDGNSIVFIHLKNDGAAISVLDLKTSQIKEILPHSWEAISRPQMVDRFIFYNSSYSGIDNIYAIDTETLKRYQVTSRKFGAFNANVSMNGQKLVFQDYTKDGYDVAEIDLDFQNFKQLENVQDKNTKYFEPLIKDEQNGSIINTKDIPTKTYDVKKYNKLANLFAVHSWGVYPISEQPILQFLAFSDNKLSTFSLLAGYNYNTNERNGETFVGARFSKYFPVFDFGVSYGDKQKIYSIGTDNWKETNYSLGVSLPFNFSRGNYFSNFTLGTSVNYLDRHNKQVIEIGDVVNGHLTVTNYYMSFMNYLEGAVKDVQPRFGQSFTARYRNTPLNEKWNGYQFSGTLNLYLPAFFRHDGLKLQGVYEQQAQITQQNKYSFYLFSSLTAYPRGYTDVPYYENYYKFSADYKFPILFPDLSLGPLAYFKRIRGGVFYDYAQGKYGSDYDHYQSIGAELIVEFHLFRIDWPFEMGFRYSYLVKEKEYQPEILIMGLPF